ncbi:MAG: spore coat protein U domain-containing protein [Burkholderiales bacterium]|nr:spore coat protein U domain-containing protein [Burkholderiales bacterium]
MLHRMGHGLGRRMGAIAAALLLAAGVPARADTSQLAVSAVVLSNSICRFLTGPATLNFGTIDPSSGTAATASTTMQFWCWGFVGTTTYSVQAGNGLYSPGAGLRRVRHTTSTSDFMAYTLNLSPASATVGRFAIQTVTVSGSIAPTEFQNARVGAYSDTVVISLDP